MLKENEQLTKPQASSRHVQTNGVETKTLVEKKGFKVDVIPGKKNHFGLSSNDVEVFVALILSRVRLSGKMSARKAAEKLNSKSPNAFARYEQGRATPSISKLEELLHAINPRLEIVIRERAA